MLPTIRSDFFFRLSLVAVALLMSCSEKAPQAQPPAATAPVIAAEPDYVEAVPVPKEAMEQAPAQPADAALKFRDGSVRRNGTALEVLDASGAVVATNGTLIRAQDENDRCPAEGFGRIVVKGNYFTVEQQTCSGMLFIDEYITFKAAPDGRILLHKFSIVKTDRSDPERNLPQRDLTTADFGELELGKVETAALYALFE